MILINAHQPAVVGGLFFHLFGKIDRCDSGLSQSKVSF